jgi:hypothetical protein
VAKIRNYRVFGTYYIIMVIFDREITPLAPLKGGKIRF